MRNQHSLLLALVFRPAMAQAPLPRLELEAGLLALDYRDSAESFTHLPRDSLLATATESWMRGVALAWVFHQR